MSNNLVKDWSEFMKLLEVITLEELNFVGKHNVFTRHNLPHMTSDISLALTLFTLNTLTHQTQWWNIITLIIVFCDLSILLPRECINVSATIIIIISTIIIISCSSSSSSSDNSNIVVIVSKSSTSSWPTSSGNPLEEKHSAEGTWRSEVERKLTALKKLDGLPIIRDVDDDLIIEQQQQQQQQPQQQESQQTQNQEEIQQEEGKEEEQIHKKDTQEKEAEGKNTG